MKQRNKKTPLSVSITKGLSGQGNSPDTEKKSYPRFIKDGIVKRALYPRLKSGKRKYGSPRRGVSKRNLTKNVNMKSVPDYKGYFAGDDGRIYFTHSITGERHQLTEFLYPKSKYLTVFLRKEKDRTGFQVHKLIARVYFGIDPADYSVKHKNKNLMDNRPDIKTAIDAAEETAEKSLERRTESDIRELETRFFEALGFNRQHRDWIEYMGIKARGVPRLTRNWLKVRG
ncbi:MAG: hypothetical protein NTV87_17320 [Ignavibacteriae bacterium]|nr:hypothetical protein [Ignavibacteriota bacterium]